MDQIDSNLLDYQEGAIKVSKWIKIAFFILLLMGASYFFGLICKQIDVAYELILLPSRELLFLLLKFLGALVALLVAAGLVAGLLRPLRIGYSAFALSGLAILLGWRISIASGALVLIYVIAGVVYTMGVDREMKERIKFSIRSVSTGQALLSLSLSLVACGSLYLGYEAYIDREGFSIPEAYIELYLDQVENQIKFPGSEEVSGQTVAELRENLKQSLEDLIYEKLVPYEPFIPLGLSAGVFMSLMTLVSLLLWLPVIFLRIIFSVLMVAGVTSVVSDMREVQWVVIS
jgi:hypothetical protein